MLKNISFESMKELSTNVINVHTRLSGKATSKDKLAAHEGIKYYCDLCDYKGTKQES